MSVRRVWKRLPESRFVGPTYGKTVRAFNVHTPRVTNPGRHDGTSRAPGAHRSTSETSSNPPAGSIMPATMGQPQPVPAQAISHGPGAMAITSIIEHPMHELAYPAQSMGDLTHTGVGPIPVSYAPEWAYGAMHSGDSPRYSSDNCSSPMSDYPNAQISYQPFQDGIQRPPSTFSDSSFHQGSIASPLPAGASFPPNWGTTDPAPAYDGSYAPTVGSHNLSQRSKCFEADTKSSLVSAITLHQCGWRTMASLTRPVNLTNKYGHGTEQPFEGP